MSDPLNLEIDPAAQEAANLLSFAKAAANDELIKFLNGVSMGTISMYPQAEVQSWPYQRVEANAILSAGESATLEMAPFITGVCIHHHGPATDTERLDQVKAKAVAIRGNDLVWSAISQFINGLRAKTQDLIIAATTPLAVNNALVAAKSETSVFLAQIQQNMNQ